MAKDPTLGPVSQYDAQGFPIKPGTEKTPPSEESQAQEPAPLEEQLEELENQPIPDQSDQTDDQNEPVNMEQPLLPGPDLETFAVYGEAVAREHLEGERKADLVEMAKSSEVEIKKSWNKTKVMDAILDAWRREVYGAMDTEPQTGGATSAQAGQGEIPPFEYDPEAGKSVRVQRTEYHTKYGVNPE